MNTLSTSIVTFDVREVTPSCWNQRKWSRFSSEAIKAWIISRYTSEWIVWVENWSYHFSHSPIIFHSCFSGSLDVIPAWTTNDTGKNSSGISQFDALKHRIFLVPTVIFVRIYLGAVQRKIWWITQFKFIVYPYQWHFTLIEQF